MPTPNEFKDITVMFTNGITRRFPGKYRRDLEKEHWHYYEDENGTMYHFRKEHMVSITEKDIYNVR